MKAEVGPLYDAFVVRMWRDAASGRLLRAEVEHAGSGAIARAAGVTAGWVLRQIHARLAERVTEEAPGAATPAGGMGSGPEPATAASGAP